MLLIVEKRNKRGICHSFHRYVKIENTYMKDHDQNKESSYTDIQCHENCL